MTDANLERLGISFHEMQRLHALWSTIAPRELTAWEWRLREQVDVMPAGWFAPEQGARDSYGSYIERGNELVYSNRENF
jgi:hypothetical protein